MCVWCVVCVYEGCVCVCDLREKWRWGSGYVCVWCVCGVCVCVCVCTVHSLTGVENRDIETRGGSSSARLLAIGCEHGRVGEVPRLRMGAADFEAGMPCNQTHCLPPDLPKGKTVPTTWHEDVSPSIPAVSSLAQKCTYSSRAPA